ncbi:radical SAM protein [Pelosinus fermentans]|uniref:Radical SAM domain protein n=1 Tax=Pelosinus fermentans JBW45 TaxID=1192197 RepID=I8TUX4_9FIRM|nr:radical SAM protein [Pelosinus fermentans]AJQ26621.1 Radical SAM domain protein [Pelosinus fermentans JBW45]
MNQEVDCLLIGYNQFNMQTQRKLLRLSVGQNSKTYREANTSNLSFIEYKKKLYSPSQLYQTFNSDINDGEENEPYYPPNMVAKSFSLAVAYLGTYINKRGISFDYINSFVSEKEYIANRLKEDSIGCVVIPTTFYILPFPIIDIVSFIRKYSENVKIIIGGPYVFGQAHSLNEEDLQKLFKSIGADIYIYNTEGEFALGEVIHSIKHNLPLGNIDNIFYKQNDRYVYTRYSQENNQPNNNFVDWNLYSDRICEFVNVRTSISCPFSCSFCGSSMYAGQYRTASIEIVEKELNTLSNKVSGVFFSDETFNFPPERFKAMLKMLIRNKYKFKWVSQLRAQYIDRETVELMKESGCVQALFGIESGNQQILDNMNKKATVKKYREVLSLLNEYDIMSTASLVVGFPGETYETYRDTFNFIEEAKPTFFRTHMWYYQHGAPINNDKEKFNIKGAGYNWSHKTMDSNTAYELSNNLFFSIKNSIYEADCSFPFQLACKKISNNKIKNFMSTFSLCVKEGLTAQGKKEVSNELIEKLKSALK